MGLREQLDADMKEAMRSRDPVRLETIRGVRGAIRNREIEAGADLDEEAIRKVIRSQVKQRAEAIEQYRTAGRPELVEKESAEKALLEAYLPAGPDEAEVLRVVREVIREVGAQGPGDLGRVMRPALDRLGAGADGRAVNQLARRLLSEAPGPDDQSA